MKYINGSDLNNSQFHQVAGDHLNKDMDWIESHRFPFSDNGKKLLRNEKVVVDDEMVLLQSLRDSRFVEKGSEEMLFSDVY